MTAELTVKNPKRFYRFRNGFMLREWLFNPYPLVRGDWYVSVDPPGGTSLSAGAIAPALSA